MKQSRSVSQEMHDFYETKKFMTVFRRAHHWVLS